MISRRKGKAEASSRHWQLFSRSNTRSRKPLHLLGFSAATPTSRYRSSRAVSSATVPSSLVQARHPHPLARAMESAQEQLKQCHLWQLFTPHLSAPPGAVMVRHSTHCCPPLEGFSAGAFLSMTTPSTAGAE